ncbi:MAG: hypothetical protein FJ276_06530 [Planctomycetes bacterium]|nr:hypothetical protein [Planctomycetota bacterium]
MTVLTTNGTEIVLSEPGTYAFERRGLRRIEPATMGTGEAPRLCVSALGDFAVSVSLAVGCRINERRVLGGIERLREGDIIDVVVSPEGAGKSGDSIRFTYSGAGPAVRFVGTRSIRCDYTAVGTAAGEAAIRCGGCFRLYRETAAWHADLGQVCPVCAWSDLQGESR